MKYAQLLLIFISYFLSALGYAQDMGQEDYRQGSIAFHQGEYNLAITDLTQALTKNPKWADAYRIRAVSRLGLRDWDGALADYTQAIQLAPEDNQNLYGLYIDRGAEKHLKRDEDGAIKDETKAIQLHPSADMAYYNRGNAELAKKDYPTAEKDFTQAIGLNPSKAGYYYFNRSAVDGLEGQWEKGIADCDQAISLNINTALVFQQRGRFKWNKGDSAGAIADMKLAGDPYPTLNLMVLKPPLDVDARVDPSSVKVGDIATVTIKYADLNTSLPHFPSVEGLIVLDHSATCSISVTKKTEIVVSSWCVNLRTTRAGDFIIPAFDLKTKAGKTFHVQALKLHVS